MSLFGGRRGFLVYQSPGQGKAAVKPAPTPTFAELCALIDAGYWTRREAHLAGVRLLERVREQEQPTPLNGTFRRKLTRQERLDEWQAKKIADGAPPPEDCERVTLVGPALDEVKE
jgi:hypothetical protein